MSHRSKKQFKDFWKSTNKLDARPSLPVKVGECGSPIDIANLFKNQFQVTSPLGASSVAFGAEFCQGSELIGFSAKEVTKVITKMAGGKSPGHDGLSIEHLRYAGVHLPRVLALFFSLCMNHSYLPSNKLRTIVVPILKNKTGDISDPANYRPISLATIIAKILDSVLDTRLDNWLSIHDAQFGFKPRLSTERAIYGLKQTVQYYVDRGTPVYACFLDLSRAFDLVSYEVLWEKLREVSVPSEVLCLFKYWYSNQTNQIRWQNSLSEEYRLECGVRQGGISSPKLFNLYLNELIVELSSKPVGCKVGNVSVNNLSYADDMVLLGPTAGSIREILRTCEEYAVKHGLMYNVRKSEYLIFGAPGKPICYKPTISLNGVPLKRVTQFKYLGHYVTDDLKDQVDMDRERRTLAARCNMLAHRFARCSVEAKITLFKAYCQNFYTGARWVNYTRKAICSACAI